MITITAADFKAYFDKGQFIYGTEITETRDTDIDRAIAEAEAVFNHDIYPLEGVETIALQYLTAHFLQLDTEAVDSQGQSKYNQNARSADGISESLSIPEWMSTGDFALYSTTYYGQKWLTLTKPYLDGAVFSVSGGTSF